MIGRRRWTTALLVAILLMCFETTPTDSQSESGPVRTKKPSTKQSTVQPAPIDITPVDAAVLRPGEDALLQCTGATGVVWYQQSTGKMLSSDQKLKHNEEQSKYEPLSNQSVIIREVEKVDIGVYLCFDSRTNKNYTVHLKMAPQVAEFNKGSSYVVYYGHSLTLSCEVYGWPVPKVTWGTAAEKVPDVVEMLYANTTDPSVTINSTELSIKDVQIQHRKHYWCVATNEVGSHRESVLVRVKGRSSFVLPLIGTIIEGVILAVIIVIYEKKKAKQAAARQEKLKEQEKLIKNDSNAD